MSSLPSTPMNAGPTRYLRFAGVPAAARGGRPIPPKSSARATSFPPAVPDDSILDEFAAWVLGQAGLDPHRYRPEPLNRRVPACLRALKVKTVDEAHRLVARGPEFLQLAVSSLLLGVTHFFRDPPVFQQLRELLPTLAPSGGDLRIWSAACSDGCELYSVAILLSELGLLKGSHLWGTDCRPEAILAAQAGVYSEESLRGLLPQQREQHFVGCQLNARMRILACFEVQDIFQLHQPGDWDVILWRNAALYVKPDAARPIWHRLVQALRPGGLLLVGKGERPDADLPLERTGTCIFRKPTAS